MRKIALFLALFYFLSTVGYGLEIHYCLGRISDVNHAMLETSCPCDTLHTKGQADGCCEERSFFNQIDDVHSYPQAQNEIGKHLPLTKVIAEIAPLLVEDNSLCIQKTDKRGPPRLCDRVIEFHAMLIYG